MPSACLWNQCSDNDDEIVEKKRNGRECDKGSPLI